MYVCHGGNLYTWEYRWFYQEDGLRSSEFLAGMSLMREMRTKLWSFCKKVCTINYFIFSRILGYFSLLKNLKSSSLSWWWLSWHSAPYACFVSHHSHGVLGLPGGCWELNLVIWKSSMCAKLLISLLLQYDIFFLAWIMSSIGNELGFHPLEVPGHCSPEWLFW